VPPLVVLIVNVVVLMVDAFIASLNVAVTIVFTPTSVCASVGAVERPSAEWYHSPLRC
jgi:hypothetical protein